MWEDRKMKSSLLILTHHPVCVFFFFFFFFFFCFFLQIIIITFIFSRVLLDLVVILVKMEVLEHVGSAVRRYVVSLFSCWLCLSCRAVEHIWQNFTFRRNFLLVYTWFYAALWEGWKLRKKYTSGTKYWNVPVLVNTGTFFVYQYCLKMWYLHSLEHAGVIQKLTILEQKNGLVLSNTCVPVSGTWSILFPKLHGRRSCMHEPENVRHWSQSDKTLIPLLDRILQIFVQIFLNCDEEV